MAFPVPRGPNKKNERDGSSKRRANMASTMTAKMMATCTAMVMQERPGMSEALNVLPPSGLRARRVGRADGGEPEVAEDLRHDLGVGQERGHRHRNSLFARRTARTGPGVHRNTRRSRFAQDRVFRRRESRRWWCRQAPLPPTAIGEDAVPACAVGAGERDQRRQTAEGMVLTRLSRKGTIRQLARGHPATPTDRSRSTAGARPTSPRTSPESTR